MYLLRLAYFLIVPLFSDKYKMHYEQREKDKIFYSKLNQTNLPPQPTEVILRSSSATVHPSTMASSNVPFSSALYAKWRIGT